MARASRRLSNPAAAHVHGARGGPAASAAPLCGAPKSGCDHRGLYWLFRRTHCDGTEHEVPMTKHSRHERVKRAEQSERMRQVEAAYGDRVPQATAEAFALAVQRARERGPEPPPADMAPGTQPRPPRPGHEPRPPKEPARSKRRW